MQTVVFLHPSWDASPSGGDKFNRRIIANARRYRFPLQSVRMEPRVPIGAEFHPDPMGTQTRRKKVSQRLRLWDSLLMGCYPALERQGGPWRDAFLMHYLPSMSPALDARARSQARILEDRIAAQVSFFVATGRGLAAVLRERYPQVASFVCEPGVDAVFPRVRRKAREGGDAPIHLLSVAHLMAAKGYRDLLSVLQQMEGRRWHWHIVGSREADAEFTREFDRLAARLIGSNRIVFHGSLSSAALARLMVSMDVFVAASYFESYGMALAEAVAAGLPVVGTRVGEAIRIVGEAEDARLVPVGDRDAFAVALMALLDTPGRCSASCCRRPPVRGWNDAFADFAAACRAGMHGLAG